MTFNNGVEKRKGTTSRVICENYAESYYESKNQNLILAFFDPNEKMNVTFGRIKRN